MSAPANHAPRLQPEAFPPAIPGRQGEKMSGVEEGRSRRWRRWGEIEAGLARLAELEMPTALQDRPSAFTVAMRAYEVRGLGFAIRILQLVDKVPFFRFPKRIAIKLGLRLIRTSDRISQDGYLHFKQSVVELRILHCESHLRYGGFNLRVASALRRLQKGLEGADRINSVSNCSGNTGGALGQAVQKLEVEIHKFHSDAQSLAQFRAAARAKLEHLTDNGATP